MLYEAPEGFVINVTAEDRHVCALVSEDLPAEFGVDLLNCYVGFEEYQAVRPISRIGYHGTRMDGEHFHVSILHDNTDRLEASLSHGSTHFHSNDFALIVGDSHRDTPRLLLWRLRDGRFEGSRIVHTQRGSFHTQILHVHPRFSPDGDRILFACDASGNGNLYLLDMPDFDWLSGEEGE